MRRFVIGMLLAAAAVLPAAAGPAEAERFAALEAEYEAFLRREDPITAGAEDDAEALARLPDASAEADARRKTALEDFARRIDALPANRLDGADVFDRDYLAYDIADRLAALSFDEGRIAFQNDSGFHTLGDYLARSTVIRSAADAEAWLARLAALPAWYDDNIKNLRRGIETGWTQPGIVVERVLRIAEAQAGAPIETDVLLAPFATAPATLDPATVAEWKAQAIGLVREQIRPRQEQFAAFLKDEYLPKARSSLATVDMPGGEDWYEFQARHHTTTTLTPDEIHDIGLAEVARIRALMDGVMAETGFAGTFAEFLQFLRTDPRFYASSRLQLLEKASEIAKRADDRLPGLFGTLPRLTYGVRPVPEDQEEGYTTGRYFPGSPQLGIAGGYMVNTGKLDQRPLYELPALTVHEAVPGHHLQIALTQELGDIPYYRRNGGATAYVEGWGLYAEYLGEEMGIYRDAYERFGRLSYEMWRACRLVADTGIHWKRWDIEQARACFTDNSALAPHNIQTELERYISWPGQALAYKIGEMKLKELRARAAEALGGSFDVRRYHDAVLLAGPMPLAMLEARIDAWIADELAKRP
ncbi:MAG: DUF885 family protein [Alphaproteobacteria bacterium]|nr:DUF885 family protein [Alphaproteobacteria bacterium]